MRSGASRGNCRLSANNRVESADASGGKEVCAGGFAALCQYLQTLARRLEIQRVEVTQLDGEIATKREQLIGALRRQNPGATGQRWAEKFAVNKCPGAKAK
jgi:hypothetical protein